MKNKPNYFHYSRFIYFAETPKGESAEKAAPQQKSEVFKKVDYDDSAKEAEKDSKAVDVAIQGEKDDIKKEGDKLGDQEIGKDFEKNVNFLNLGTLEADASAAVHEKMDKSGVLKDRVTSALNLFDETLNIEAFGITEKDPAGKGTAKFEKLSGSLSLTDQLSVFAEHWNGNSQFYGLNFTLPEGKYGKSEVNVSYSPKDKVVWIEGKMDKFSGSTSVQLKGPEESKGVTGVEGVAHVALGYDIDDKSKLKVHIDQDGARFAFQMRW